MLPTTMDILLERLGALTATHVIPGLSFATLRGGFPEAAHALGTRGAHDRRPVNAQTVFEAASLTKPLVAFIALQLAEEGLLDLGRPLVDICGEYVADDARARQITAHHVLTHTSGLPNIVRAEAPLKTHFEPGARFSYSSSAFGWLQRAMEVVTDRPLETLARQRVFTSMEMHDSSLEWHERFEANHAQGHEWEGKPVLKRRVKSAQASWSLHTTASDYLRFVQAVMKGQGLSRQTLGRWFTPEVRARRGEDVEDLLGVNPPSEHIAWGLGWGLEPARQSFFHWGHSPGFRAYVVGNRVTRDAVVWFANSARGLRLAHLILPAVLNEEHPSVEWLKIGQL